MGQPAGAISSTGAQAPPADGVHTPSPEAQALQSTGTLSGIGAQAPPEAQASKTNELFGVVGSGTVVRGEKIRVTESVGHFGLDEHVTTLSGLVCHFFIECDETCFPEPVMLDDADLFGSFEVMVHYPFVYADAFIGRVLTYLLRRDMAWGRFFLHLFLALCFLLYLEGKVLYRCKRFLWYMHVYVFGRQITYMGADGYLGTRHEPGLSDYVWRNITWSAYLTGQLILHLREVCAYVTIWFVTMHLFIARGCSLLHDTTVYDSQTGDIVFQDSNADQVIDDRGARDPTFMVGSNGDVHDEAFFRRPVSIGTVTWEVGENLNLKVNVWEKFFKNSSVANRLKNYNLLRCNLHVKILVNGVSFHTGRALVSYHPLWDPDTTMKGNYEGVWCQRSQVGNFVIDPSLNVGGEIVAPFFSSSTWIHIPTEKWDIGKLCINSKQTLRHANGGTDAASLTILVWAEDIEICGSTSQSQVGTEYKPDGLISRVATGVAYAAGRLTKVPYIGKFAQATQIASGAIGQIASMFGFSRPVILTSMIGSVERAAGNFCNMDQQEMVTKLSLDSKQELTIDPRVVGLDGTDEMAFANIWSKSTHFRTVDWPDTANQNESLGHINVEPTACVIEGTRFFNTPLSFCAQPFEYWTGTIVYDFDVVASRQHSGRLRIVYDPNVHAAEADIAYNTSFSMVVDITEKKQFQLVVPWSSEVCYKKVRPFYEDHDVLLGAMQPFANGTISVYVVGKLVSPSDTDSGVHINVRMRAGDDFQVSKPTSSNVTACSYFPIDDIDIDAQSGIGVPSDNSLLPRVFFGESIVSFRQLLKRYWHHSSVSILPETGLQCIQVTVPNMPSYFGYDSKGIDHDGPKRVNAVNMTMLNYISPCFLGWRGSIRSKYELLGESLSTVRVHTELQDYGVTQKVVSDYANEGNVHLRVQQYLGSTGAGIAIEDSKKPVLEVEHVFYSPLRFANARVITYGGSGGVDLTDEMRHSFLYMTRVEGTNPGKHILNRYVAIGEDFGLHYFAGVPGMTPLWLNTLAREV
jgi:hypothetical protein